MEKYRKCSEKWRKEIEEVEDEESESENDNVGVGRTYGCNYCKRGFTNAQALGGHMNIHRKDKAKARQHHHPSNFSSSSSSSLISYKPNSAVMEIEMEMEPLPVPAYSSSFAPQPQKNHHHHRQLYYPFAHNINSPCPRFISSHQPSIFEVSNNNNHHLHLHHEIPNTTASRTRRLFGMHGEEDPLGTDLSLRISSSAIIDHPFQGNIVRDHNNNNNNNNNNTINNNNNNNNNKEHVDYINHGIDLELRLGYYP